MSVFLFSVALAVEPLAGWGRTWSLEGGATGAWSGDSRFLATEHGVLDRLEDVVIDRRSCGPVLAVSAAGEAMALCSGEAVITALDGTSSREPASCLTTSARVGWVEGAGFVAVGRDTAWRQGRGCGAHSYQSGDLPARAIKLRKEGAWYASRQLRIPMPISLRGPVQASPDGSTVASARRVVETTAGAGLTVREHNTARPLEQGDQQWAVLGETLVRRDGTASWQPVAQLGARGKLVGSAFGTLERGLWALADDQLETWTLPKAPQETTASPDGALLFLMRDRTGAGIYRWEPGSDELAWVLSPSSEARHLTAGPDYGMAWVDSDEVKIWQPHQELRAEAFVRDIQGLHALDDELLVQVRGGTVRLSWEGDRLGPGQAPPAASERELVPSALRLRVAATLPHHEITRIGAGMFAWTTSQAWPEGGGRPQVLDGRVLASWDDRVLLHHDDGLDLWVSTPTGMQQLTRRDLDATHVQRVGDLLWLATARLAYVSDLGLDELIELDLPWHGLGEVHLVDGDTVITSKYGLARLDREHRVVEHLELQRASYATDFAWAAQLVGSSLLVRRLGTEELRTVEGVGSGVVAFLPGHVTAEDGRRAWTLPSLDEVTPPETSRRTSEPMVLRWHGQRAWAVMTSDGRMVGEDPDGTLVREGDTSSTTVFGDVEVLRPGTPRELDIVPLVVEPRGCSSSGAGTLWLLGLWMSHRRRRTR